MRIMISNNYVLIKTWYNITMVKFFKHILAILLGGILGLFIFFTFIDTLSKYIIKDALILSAKQYKSTSTLYAKNGDVIASVYPAEALIPINKKVDDDVIKILLALEDKRFYEHKGIDYISIIRAAIENIKSGEITQGGSTITQQLVKNEFLNSKKSFERKFYEAFYALLIETKYKKDEILDNYLNTVYLGGSIYGLETAAYNWFNKSSNDLTQDELILILNTIPSPTYFNPYLNPEKAYERYKFVLKDLYIKKELTQQQYYNLNNINPIDKLEVIKNTNKLITNYPWLYNTILYELKKNTEGIKLTDGSVNIYTNVDLYLQDEMENAIEKNLSKDGAPDGAGVVLDGSNIIALVGGKNFNVSEVNSALGIFGGGSGRQSGSLLKFITLVTALENGYKLTDIVDAPKEIPLKGRDPVTNYDKKSYGRISIQDAFRLSVNTAFVGLAEKLGSKKIITQGKKMGIDLKQRGADITLGIDEVSPLDMSSMYAMVNTDGMYIEPRLITKITKNDREIPIRQQRVNIGFSKENIPSLKLALRSVVANGTGRAASIGNLPIMGKTGTTDNYTNAWFVGSYGNITSTIWVGYLKGQIPMKNINGYANVAGGTIPANIFANSLIKYLKNLYPKQYKIPFKVDLVKESSIDELLPETEQLTDLPAEPDILLDGNDKNEDTSMEVGVSEIEKPVIEKEETIKIEENIDIIATE